MRRTQIWRASAYTIEAQSQRRQPFKRIKTLAGLGVQGAIEAFADTVTRVVALDPIDRSRWGRALRLRSPDGRVVETVLVEAKRREIIAAAAPEIADGRVPDMVAGPNGGEL